MNRHHDKRSAAERLAEWRGIVGPDGTVRGIKVVRSASEGEMTSDERLIISMSDRIEELEREVEQFRSNYTEALLALSRSASSATRLSDVESIPEYFAKPGIAENLAAAHPVLLVRQMANEILRLRSAVSAIAPFPAEVLTKAREFYVRADDAGFLARAIVAASSAAHAIAPIEVPYRAELVFDHERRVVTGTFALSSIAPIPPTPDSPFNKSAADDMAAAVDVMIRRKMLDPRSLVADARLNYGKPFENAEEVVFRGAMPVSATQRRPE